VIEQRVFKVLDAYGVGVKMDRVLFKSGEQRKFLDLIISQLGSISLRGILQFGFEVKYSSLKNYYTERRMIPKDFFEELCYLAKVSVEDLDVEYVAENIGQIKGGRVSKRKV